MKTGKRALVLMLSVLMMFSTFPASVFADDEAAPEPAAKVAEEQEPAKEVAPEPKPEAPAEPIKEEVTPSEPAENSTESNAGDQGGQYEDSNNADVAEGNGQEDLLPTDTEATMTVQAIGEIQADDEDVETVTVTLNATDGVFSNGAKTMSVKIKKGSRFRRTDIPEEPTIDTSTGKGFLRWVKRADYDVNPESGNSYDFGQVDVNSDLELCAVWGTASLQFGVYTDSRGMGSVYIDNDRTTMTTETRWWEGPAGKHTLHAVPAEGYKFHYWSGINDSGRVYEQDYTRTYGSGTDAVYAHFIKADSAIYAIEYWPGEGTSLAENTPIRRVTEEGGGEHTLLTDSSFLAPDGKTFDNWKVEIGNDKPIYKDPGDIINVTADTKVTAMYKARPRVIEVVIESGSASMFDSVTFSGEGVEVNDKDTMVAEADIGSNVTITITPKPGNKVKKVYCYKPGSSTSEVDYVLPDSTWGISTSINDDGSGTVSFNVDDGGAMWLMVELEAMPELTVTFESNGGSTVEDQTVTWGQKASKPADPLKEGFMFKGWYSDEALTKTYDFSASVKENIKLYAKWAKTVLTFDPNGGVMNGSTSPVKMECSPGEEITIPDAPTRDGYEFQYWEGSQYYPGDKYTVTEEDHYFTAIWKEVSTPDDTDEDSDTSDSDSSSSEKKSKGVDTGDATGLIGWLLLGIAAEAGAVYMYRRRRREY